MEKKELPIVTDKLISPKITADEISARTNEFIGKILDRYSKYGELKSEEVKCDKRAESVFAEAFASLAAGLILFFVWLFLDASECNKILASTTNILWISGFVGFVIFLGVFVYLLAKEDKVVSLQNKLYEDFEKDCAAVGIENESGPLEEFLSGELKLEPANVFTPLGNVPVYDKKYTDGSLNVMWEIDRGEDTVNLTAYIDGVVYKTWQYKTPNNPANFNKLINGDFSFLDDTWQSTLKVIEKLEESWK